MAHMIASIIYTHSPSRFRLRNQLMERGFTVVAAPASWYKKLSPGENRWGIQDGIQNSGVRIQHGKKQRYDCLEETTKLLEAYVSSILNSFLNDFKHK